MTAKLPAYWDDFAVLARSQPTALPAGTVRSGIPWAVGWTTGP
jgi:hypothetical protein